MYLDTEAHVNDETLGVADGKGHGVVSYHGAADVDVHLEVRPRPEVPARKLNRTKQNQKNTNKQTNKNEQESHTIRATSHGSSSTAVL